jgi:hypothetical protein
LTPLPTPRAQPSAAPLRLSASVIMQLQRRPAPRQPRQWVLALRRRGRKAPLRSRVRRLRWGLRFHRRWLRCDKVSLYSAIRTCFD